MTPTEDITLRVRIEIPMGSRNKYEVNRETGEIELDRRLHASVTYPVDYGFVPDTLAEDGDELDAMVCLTEPTFPGCVIPARPIGLMRMTSGGDRNDKVLCVPISDPSWQRYTEVDDLPQDLGTEILHFFRAYNTLEGADWNIEGWAPAEDAVAAVGKARDRLSATQ